MSYIAKVHLNKMFPKSGEGAPKIEGEWLVMSFFNILNPMSNNNPPKDKETLINSFELIGDDKIQIAGKGNPSAPMKAMWKGNTYTVDNFLSVKDKVVPAGDQVIFYFKNPGWKAGETHKLTINIIQDRPIKFSIERQIM